MKQEYNYHARVMGCDFDMTFIAESSDQADKYFIQARDIAKVYEKQFSRFDENSEISLINENRSLKVSQRFLDVYWIAYNLYKKTHGQFNPLVQVSRIGYDKTFEKIENYKYKNSNENDYNVNLDDVVVLSDKLILQDSQKLDFGGFLKGLLAEKIAKSIKSDYGIIINIGGDMYVRGKNERGKKFIVEIAHPFDELKNISFPISDKALCTSGTYKRNWNTNSGKKHHILNFETKDSTQTDIISVSVLHNEGALADAYATLAVTLGSSKAQEFFNKQKMEFVIICANHDIITSDKFK